MALAEGPPPGVLPRQADVGALEQHRSERQGLAQRPVHLAVGHHLGPLLELPEQFRMHGEALGHRGGLRRQPLELVACHAGGHRRTRRGCEGRRRQRRGTRRGALAGLVQRHLQAGLEVLEGPLGLLHGDVAPTDQCLGVELAHRALPFDDGVHAGLGVARVVSLVVAVAPVAHEVDHDVLVEGLAEPERQARGAHTRFGVVAVHVEDRGLDHLGHVGRVHRRSGRLGRGGEPQLVVHHHVDRPPGAVSGKLRELEGLGHHALAGEGGVAVDEHRQHVEAPVCAQHVLLGPHHPLDHGVDRLEMRGVRRQRDRELGPGPGHELARRPLVVLDVPRALDRLGIEIALELPEDLAVGLAHDVGQDVQPAPVGHAEHGLGRPGAGAFVEDGVEEHDGRLGPFEAEPLLPHVAGVEEALERLGRVEAVEDVALLDGVEGGGHALDVLLDPPLLLGVLDVHVLDAQGAAVGVAQDVERLAQA